MRLFFSAALTLSCLAACPPSGECVEDSDCDTGFGCREDPNGDTICIQLVGGGDAGPGDAVEITSFTIAPAVVAQGGEATLTWTTENATTCAISGGVGGVDLNGSVSITIDEEETFRLNCQGPEGPVTADVDALVEIAITSFTITPEDVDIGNPVTATWETVGASDCVIDVDSELTTVPTTGTQELTIASSAQVLLVCQGPSGNATEAIAVDVARILALTASPPAVAAGQEVTLGWAVENLDDCAIFGETDPDDTDDLLVVTPTVSTAYSLRCTGFQGEVRLDREAVVLIERFEAENATVASGADAVFEFDLDLRVASCTLDDDTAVTLADGNVTIAGITADTTRSMTCVDGSGLTATSAPVTVTVE